MKERFGECPLGAKCEEVVQENGEQVLVRCPWYLRIQGRDPQSGDTKDEWRCAIAWMPFLSMHQHQAMQQTGASVDNLRTEVARGNNRFAIAIEGRKRLGQAD